MAKNMMKARHLIISVAFGALLLPAAVLAQGAGNLSSLVGARAAGGETQLEAQGYVHVRTQKGDDRAWSYWWQSQRHECISVAVVEGRFDSITSTPSADCNQKGGHDVPDQGAKNDSVQVNLNDLITQHAAWADVQIQKRGFKTVNAYKAGDSAYTIRWNDQTGQCVQVAVKDDRIRYISAVKQSACH